MNYLSACIINLIIYVFLTSPVFIALTKKEILSTKKKLILTLAILFIIESFLYSLYYQFSYIFFTIFPISLGTINLTIFISRIVFLDSSLYPIKFLIPFYLYKKNKTLTIKFVFSKIIVNVLLAFINYLFLKTVGIFYSFPICNFIYYLIYIWLFIKY